MTIADEDGRPVRAAYVLFAEALDGDFAVWAVAGADADGVVVRDGLPRRQCVVVVRHPGYATVRRYVDASTDEVDFRLPAASDVHGIVTLDGEPVAGASVWCGGERTLLGTAGAVARTDGQGRFRLTDVPRDANVWLQAEHDELGAGTAPLMHDSDRSNVRVGLVDRGAVHGAELCSRRTDAESAEAARPRLYAARIAAVEHRAERGACHGCRLHICSMR